MSRVLKAPEIRRQEIIETAMNLFHEKGYDATSIADIAKEMNVVPGLCYRYFNSKKEIFDVAVREYAKESCQDIISVLNDHNKPTMNRIEALCMIMLHKEDSSRLHDFFHTPGNETFHLQLCIEMINFLTPHLSQALSDLNTEGEAHIDDPTMMTKFILYGMISLLLPFENAQDEALSVQLERMMRYVYNLLGLEE